VAVHRIAARLGHASIQPTSRYLAETEHDLGTVGEILDRRPPARGTPWWCLTAVLLASP